MKRELTVHVVHGEGDRDTVNALQAYRNTVASPPVEESPDEPPDVLVVLRDEAHRLRIELPLLTWEEVEEWKQKAGWDAERRQFKHGAKVKLVI